jgi:hypothetical protein
MTDHRRDYGPQGCAEKGVFFGFLVALMFGLFRKGGKR